MWAEISSAKDAADVSEILNRFLLITFADLKKYRYYYWFAFPAFAAKPAWTLEPSGWRGVESTFAQQTVSHDLNLQMECNSKLHHNTALGNSQSDCDVVVGYPSGFRPSLQPK